MCLPPQAGRQAGRPPLLTACRGREICALAPQAGRPPLLTACCDASCYAHLRGRMYTPSPGQGDVAAATLAKVMPLRLLWLICSRQALAHAEQAVAGRHWPMRNGLWQAGIGPGAMDCYQPSASYSSIRPSDVHRICARCMLPPLPCPAAATARPYRL